MRGFGATSPDRTDGSWIVTLSEPAGAYMAARRWKPRSCSTTSTAAASTPRQFRRHRSRRSQHDRQPPLPGQGTLDDFLQRLAADRPGAAARQKWARPCGGRARNQAARADGGDVAGRTGEGAGGSAHRVCAAGHLRAPRLPSAVCFDGIKAHALCERVAQRTGGTVLPTFFYGTGGGHVGYKWTLMLPEPQIAPLIEATLDHLARQGFKVVVLLTGHYPKEQVDMVHRLAQEAQKRHPHVRFIGLTEPEVTTPEPGDAYGGDHAAKYETSIALALNPAGSVWTA